uniref:RNA polymerase sigma factor region1.1 domain-containing protein n=1 Tax=Arsukibacterium sp. TaxID=1977258 RepID=UPI003569E8E4
MEQSPQSQLKLLIIKGKEQGYLTFAEVNDHLPQDIIDSDQIEDIVRMINDMGIQVFENAPDADDLIMADASTDEDAAEEAAQALVSVDKELGRTTDPVRMYMREMGTVELLTREGEIDIAKRIEDGINQVQTSVAEYPEAITYLLEQWDKFEAEEIRLSDIVSAFIDPNEIDEAPVIASHIGSDVPEDKQDDDNDDNDDDDSDDDSEADTGPDPEEARIKFGELRTQYDVTRNSIEKNGREHATTKTEIEKLSEVFRCFRLVPKQFD